MYIQRDIDRVLTEWKNAPRRKPLLLRGVRQCGKTSAVRQLGKSFESYLEINLERNPGLKKLFEGNLDVKRILSRLELESTRAIQPGKTLLFIDEIQTCPAALTALRYFYEEMPELHVIAAGSLLEIVLSDARASEPIHFPVGRVRSIYMYPFSFSEFLRGMGQEKLSARLDTLPAEVPETTLHEKLLELYKTFLVVGGMPEAVSVYAESGSFLACQRVHRDILTNFMDDFSKYGSHLPPEVLRQVFTFSLHHICDQLRASSALPGLNAYQFEEALKLLRRAGLVYPVLASSCETIPPGTSAKTAGQKLLAFDTGVYLTECAMDAGGLLGAELFDEMNKGDVVELQTGLEMIKSADPYAEAHLYYWFRSGANAEVDYVFQKGTKIFPVEVKASGKGRMQSLYSFLDTHPETPYGYRVSLENFCEYERVHVFPVYAVRQLCRVREEGFREFITE